MMTRVVTTNETRARVIGTRISMTSTIRAAARACVPTGDIDKVDGGPTFSPNIYHPEQVRDLARDNLGFLTRNHNNSVDRVS